VYRPFHWIARSVWPSALCVLASWSCATSGAGTANLDATLWVQTSVEYEAVARSLYAAATRDLEAALADPGRSAALEQTGGYSGLPPAVIVDVDETVLDNSPYQARLLLAGRSYDGQSWADWVHEERAEPVPGALEFALTADELGITVFYVTNRKADLEASTRANLENLGFPLRGDVDAVLTRGEQPGWTSDKTSRRQTVTRTHRVLMLLGDDLNDFVAVGQRSAEERAALAARYGDYWGDRWRMLPGPTYGSWERALYGFDYGLSDGARLEKKSEHLDPAT
jgi:acid phosphatase